MIRRYAIEAEETVSPINADMYEQPNGEYVLYDEIKHLLERDESIEKELVKELKAKNQRMREALERAIENKFEPDKWLFPAQEALKEEE